MKECKDVETFEKELAEAGDRLILVEFSAVWCFPCTMMKPHVQSLENEMHDVVFLTVDVDQNAATAEKYEVEAMPTYIFLKSTEKKDQIMGADIGKLKAMMIELVNPQSP
mmetsp:Transcript_95456/g.165805  ORF Transcript_95456/g.165805 Transcript_95456/m.165805 type:complete len:110 (+) Transcript_95456:161-490(+)